jgi:RNA polymerase sigma-70 factor (ECF subfamily)
MQNDIDKEKQKLSLGHAEYIRLLMSNQARIATYIQALVQNFQDAEDIFQDTAAIAWEKFDEYQSGTNFTAWAITIARYRIQYYWSRNKKSIVRYSDAAVKSIEEHISNTTQRTPGNQRLLDECMQKLPEQDVKLIRMRYSRKITIKAMADELGRSIHGLYSTLSRIHVVLAECIQRHKLAEERQ